MSTDSSQESFVFVGDTITYQHKDSRSLYQVGVLHDNEENRRLSQRIRFNNIAEEAEASQWETVWGRVRGLLGGESSVDYREFADDPNSLKKSWEGDERDVLRLGAQEFSSIEADSAVAVVGILYAKLQRISVVPTLTIQEVAVNSNARRAGLASLLLREVLDTERYFGGINNSKKLNIKADIPIVGHSAAKGLFEQAGFVPSDEGVWSNSKTITLRSERSKVKRQLQRTLSVKFATVMQGFDGLEFEEVDESDVAASNNP